MADPVLGSPAWIEEQLRRQLGADAALGSIAFEGRLLHVEATRLPLGAGLFVVERATFELGAGAPLGPLPLAARLVALRGRFEAEGLCVPLELLAVAEPAASWFDGSLRIAGAAIHGVTFDLEATLTVTPEGLRVRGGHLTASRGAHVASADLAIELAPQGPLTSPLPLRGRLSAPRVTVSRGGSSLRVDDLVATLDVDRRRVRYADLSARAHGARLGGWGRLPLGAPEGAEGVPLAAISLADVAPPLIERAAAVAGLPPSPLPDDLLAGGELMLRLDLSAAAALLVTTPRTELRLRVAVAPDGGLLGSTLRGSLSTADAITVGIFPGPVRPRRDGRLAVDAHLTGSLLAPGLAGRVSAATLVLEVDGEPALPSFLLEEASVLLDVDRDRLVWHRLAGRFYGGTFTASGRYAFDPGDLDATLSFSAVRVEQLPTEPSGASRLAALIQGAASGELRFELRPYAGPYPSARGQITIADPRYLALKELAPLLARYGLPRVPPHGRGPLSAHLRFDRDELRVEGLTGAVEGIEVSGALRVGLDGRLAGQATLQIFDVYLAQSPLLALPATFAGRVAVPVELGGSVAAPELRTDARAVLESLLVENRVGDAFKSVIAGLRSAAEGQRRERRRRQRRW